MVSVVRGRGIHSRCVALNVALGGDDVFPGVVGS